MGHVDFREGERFQKVKLQFLLYKLYTARICSSVIPAYSPDQSFPFRRKQTGRKPALQCTEKRCQPDLGDIRQIRTVGGLEAKTSICQIDLINGQNP